ncbi:MAG: hypothetical protein CVU46_09495 [Chloroflexi bacterium HGW-Chloroflexi-8]|jgi:hypothetical protein|nr:MAG: hypothetical protein CVU46_09495 [Chloroflexi bacterium HGW-Chloroflexi-8]
MQEISVKLGQLVNAEQAIEKLAKNTALPMNIKYRISKLLRQVGKEFEAYLEANKALLEKYGTPVDGKPGTFKFDPIERAQEYTAEINKLREEVVSLAWIPVPIAVFEDCKEITAGDLNLIDWLIEDEESVPQN